MGLRTTGLAPGSASVFSPFFWFLPSIRLTSIIYRSPIQESKPVDTLPDGGRRILVEQGLGMEPTRGQGSNDERVWLEAALRGDREAFGALVSRYAERIYNVAYRLVGEEADAHDLAQDTFVSAFKALSAFRADARFSTWLYRIAVNKCKELVADAGPLRAAERGQRGRGLS